MFDWRCKKVAKNDDRTKDSDSRATIRVRHPDISAATEDALDDDITRRIRRTEGPRQDDDSGFSVSARTTKMDRKSYPFDLEEPDGEDDKDNLVRAYIDMRTGNTVGVALQSDRRWAQQMRARLALARSYLPRAEDGSRNVRDDVIEELCDIIEALLARLGM